MIGTAGRNLGAEIELGGRTGPEQSPTAATRLGRQLSVNWFRPASGNLYSSLASGTPSFRSSWQSVVNGWRAGPRGANDSENEQGSGGATPGVMNGAMDGSVANKEQAVLSTAGGGSIIASRRLTAQQNGFATNASDAEDVQLHRGRSQWKSAQDTATRPASTVSAAATSAEPTRTEYQDATNRDRVEFAVQHDRQENTQLDANAGAQTTVPAIATSTVPPLAPASAENPAWTQSADAAPISESVFVLSGWGSTQTRALERLPGAGMTMTAPAGTSMVSSRVAPLAAGTRAMPVGPASILHSNEHGDIANQAAASYPEDSTEPGTSQRMTMHSSTQTPPASAQSGPSTPDSEIPPASGENVVASTVPLPIAPGTDQSSADAVRNGSTQMEGRAVSRAASRDATGEPVAAPTPGTTAQPGGETAVSAALRTRAVRHVSVASSLGEASKPGVSRGMAPDSSSEVLSANAQQPTQSARIVANNASFVVQPAPVTKADPLTHTTYAGSVAHFSASPTSGSGTAATSAYTPQDNSKPAEERAVPRVASHDAAGGPGALTPLAAAQPASVEVAASVGLRAPESSQLPAAPGLDHQHFAQAASAAASARETFSALDAGGSLGTPAWTHAGSQHAEAGFRDPALGWVGVRADLNAGGIHATLVPSSAAAAEALSGHLAGLNTHLAEQQAPLASLSMASPGESGIDSGLGQHMHQGADENAQGAAPGQSQTTSPQNAATDVGTSISISAEQSSGLDSHAHSDDLRGTHISVMA